MVCKVLIENEILKLIAANKNTKPLYDGQYRRDRVISPGDKVYIYYRGYEIDENGVRQELKNTSNYTSDSATALEIGSGSYVTGFELGLIGKVPNQYNLFEKKTKGDVLEGEVAYITTTYVKENGLIYESAEIRVDFTDISAAEARWGEGFYEYVREKQIGVTNSEVMTLPTADGNQITYTNLKVNYTTKCEGNNIVVETVFPHNYKDKSLANKTVYFDVFVEKVLCYDAPVFDDSFVTEKLGVKAEALADYEGETLADKYRAKMEADLWTLHEENIATAAEELMWERLSKLIEVELPGKEVAALYKQYIANYSSEYQRMNEMGAGYESFDEFMGETLGIEGGAGWTEIIRASVEDEISEKLIFYTIIRREKLLPDEAKLQEIYRKELELDYEYYTGKTRDDFLTDADYDSAIKDYEKQILDYYGKEFYLDSVYYNYACDEIIKFANIVNKRASK